MISMNQIWDEAIAFVRREAALLIPLALATLYVGDVAAGIATAAAKPGEPSVLLTMTVVLAALWSITGQLSVAALVLKPGQSVGEALSLGLSRLGKVVIIAVLLFLLASVALLPVAVAAIANGADAARPETIQNLPGWISVVMLVILGAIVWLGVRLALMNALIVDRNPGVVEALKGGFALTRGIAARLMLVVVLYGVILLILGSAVRFVAGSLFALVGAALDSPFSGLVMTALVAGLVNTAMSLIATVFLAVLYRHVSGKSLADIF